MRRPLRPPPEAVRDFPSGPAAQPTMGLRFFFTGDAVEATWRADALLEGWNGLAHGAAFAALHDSAAIYAMVALAGQCGFTTEMDVRFLRPIRLGDEVLVRGRVAAQDARSVTIASELLVQDRVMSTARTVYAVADAAMVERLLRAPLSDYMRAWLAAGPGERTRLALAWGEGADKPG